MSDDESKGAGAAAGTDSQAYIKFKEALKAKGKDVNKFQLLSNEAFEKLMNKYGVDVDDQGDVIDDFRKHFPLPTNTGTQLPVPLFPLCCYAPLFPVCPFRSLCCCLLRCWRGPPRGTFLPSTGRLSFAALLCGALRSFPHSCLHLRVSVCHVMDGADAERERALQLQVEELQRNGNANCMISLV
jgi:hypothetical protein